MTQKRNSSSFMIEDILGHLGSKTPGSHSERTTDSSDKCPHTISNNIPSYCALPERHSGAHPFEFGQQTSQFPPPVSPYEPSSPGTFPSRFAGYPPPFLPVSPPLASSSRDILAFFPNDFSERYLTTSQESFMRSSMFSASAVLDLSNYVHKPCRTRAMHQAISSMPSSAVEASRQIIWKHIPRNPAKRKGGQIRFTSEQTATLESTFSEHKYLSSNERKRLAAALKLSERQVKTWFQNRRAKWRRIKQEPMGHISSPESDDSDHQIDESCKLEHSCCHGNRHSQLESLEPMKTPRC